MARKGRFSVKKVRLKANGYEYISFKVEGKLNNRRYRRHFPTREEAEGHCQQVEIEALNSEDRVRMAMTHLKPAQLRDAEAALQILGDRTTLTAAADWHRRTYRDSLTEESVDDVSAVFLADREESDVSKGTLSDYRSSLKHFGEFIQGRALPGISTGDVEEFLKSRGLSGKSWNNTRSDLNAFFNWCAKAPRGWITHNPVEDVKSFKVTRGLPEILSAEKVERLFEFVEGFSGFEKHPAKPGCLVNYFALAVFAGIRPGVNDGELRRLAQVSDISRFINFTTNTIRLEPEITKTKDVRQVKIQPNLAEWLRAYPLNKYPIFPKNAIDMIREVRRENSLAHNVLRHTFISMHVGKFRSMGDTALQAGNSESMIKKHYYNSVTEEEAARFWEIRPRRV